MIILKQTNKKTIINIQKHTQYNRAQIYRQENG